MIKSILGAFFLIFAFSVAQSQTILTGTLSASTVCAGGTFNVPYSAIGTFTGGNVFTAQLSDGAGSFTSPVAIGSITSTTSSTIAVTIPIAQPGATGYKVRVVSSTPSVTGTISITTLTIKAVGLGSPTLAGTTFCAGATVNVTNNLLSTCGFSAGNVFTVQLSDIFGNFGAPTPIGSATTTAGGTISVTFPNALATNPNYRIRVVSSNPAMNGPDNGANLTIDALGLNAPTFTGTTFCPGAAIAVNYTVINSCNFPAGNVFSAELSNSAGSFASPVVIGTTTSNTSGSIAATIPYTTGASGGVSYRIRVTASNPAIASPPNGFNFTIDALSLGTASVPGTVFCGGAAFNVTYGLTACPFAPGNVFTAQLSDPSGSFSSPSTIGSVTATGAGTIPVNIPVSIPSGTLYRIRVVASSPASISSDNGANLTFQPTSLDNPQFTGTTFCAGNSFTLNYTGGCSFQSGNVFTAQLSNAAGSFAAPVTIGTLTSAASPGNFQVTIPATTPSGNAYRIRLVTSNPAVTSVDNGSDLTINVAAITAPIFAGTTFCQSQAFNVNYTVTNGCSITNLPLNNVFTAQLSNAAGSFAAPIGIGTLTTTGSGSIPVTIPAAQAAGTGYRIRVVSNNPGAGLTSPDNGTNLTVNILSITAPTFSGTAFCQSQAVAISFTIASGCTVPDVPSANIFTAQLSDAVGSFTSSTAIGTLTSNSSGTINATIPAAQAAGTGYHIRVVSSNPGTGLISPINTTGNLKISVLTINAPTLSTGATLCQGQNLNVSYVVPNTCGFPDTPANNVFTAQLSDAAGSFASPVTIGTLTADVSGTIPVTIPVTTPAGTAYHIRVISSNPGTPIISPNNASALTINVISLGTPTFTGTSFCQSGTFNLTYTVPGCPFLSGNVFTAQLSDQFGNFSAPTPIGTTTATTGGTIACTIASNAIAGNAYRIRVVSSNPSIISADNGANLSIKALAISVPTLTQSSYCQGNALIVSYTVLNSCNFPNVPLQNVFTAQLSDASGSFASPVNIGSITTQTSQNIACTIPANQAVGSGYRIRVVSSNPGSGIIGPDNGSNITIAATAGNPAVYGNGVWDAYVYNATTLTNYSGFYTENNLSFNTTTRFPGANAPSTADNSTGSAYAGCAVANTNYTIAFKRTNFACGYYQIDIPNHDDNITLIVNGTTIVSYTYDGLSHTNVWSGFLGATNTVEFQLTNFGGNGSLQINMSTSATPITTSPPVTICNTASTTLTASSSLPLTFAWTPLSHLTPSNGVGASVTAAPTTTTTYTVTGTDASSGCTTSASVLVTVSNTFTTTVTNTMPSICTGVNTTTLTASGANTYTWSPATGLSATTGNQVTANPPSTTLYTVVGSNGCTTKNATTTVTVAAIPTTPNPSTFGNNVWNVYGYNDQTLTNFYGYYTENVLSFNTNPRWNNSIGPWVANNTGGLAWNGCTGSSTSWSMSFKRTNFTCGYYQIDVPTHDDYLTLLIDGVIVFQHTNGCCDAHTNVFTGFLGPNTKVEWQLINTGGPGNLQITIAPSTVSPLTTNPGVTVCSGQPANLNSSTGITGVTYAWTNSAGNNNLIASPTSPNTTAGPLTASDTYTVTITDAGNTGCTYAASIPVTVNPTANTSVSPTTGSSFCPGTSYTLTATGANAYSWSPAAGLNVTDQYQVIASPTVTTTYTVTGTTGCGSKDATATITVNPIASVSTFPTGTWNNYCFNSTTVGTNYEGYYTDNGNGTSGYDFDSRTRWASGAAPSTANATNGQAYHGCAMPISNISLSFKRTGFTCGLYQLNVTFHDDGFVLLINGVQVAAHNGCCDTHSAIWTGMLNPASTVEWQMVQGSGGSGLAVTFVPQTFATSTSIWIGSVSTDWFNAANWCSAVPTSTTDAIIPAGAVNFPAINGAGAQVRTITISAPVAAGTYNSALAGASLTTTGSSNLDVFGNWLNGNIFTANTGTLTFRGTNSGNVISNTFPTTFHDMILNKTNGITNSVGLLQISNLLTFTAGIFTDQTAINILSGGTYAGASNSSYIDGPVTKTGNVAFSFPVGTGGFLRPISISAPSLATDNFTAQYFHSNPAPTYPNTQVQAPIDHVSAAEYWILNRSGGSSNVSVTIGWNSNSGGVGNLPSLRVVRWNAATSQWANEGNSTTTGNTTAGTITSGAAVSTFSSPNSPFSLGSTSLANTLPIELTDFTTILVSPGVVRLDWATESEINNDRFDVERSQDGTTFAAILSVPGNGTTTVKHHYSIQDVNAPAGTIYYRLRQIDVDGRSTVTEKESVDNPFTNSVSLYPNPAGESFAIDLKGRTVNSFSMIDMMEKELSVPFTIGSDKITVTTASLAPGIYIVQIVLDGRAFRVKMIRK